LLAKLLPSAQVHQARAEAEAAAEQRLAGALALERAELDKQVQFRLLCSSAAVQRCSGLVLRSVDASADGCHGYTCHVGVAWGV